MTDFSLQLMQSGRSAEARTRLAAVQQRHDEIQNIERTMIELAELFQDLERIVVEQEPLVENIEKQAEQVQDDLVKGNTEMATAVTSARAARKKKWICLGICGKSSALTVETSFEVNSTDVAIQSPSSLSSSSSCSCTWPSPASSSLPRQRPPASQRKRRLDTPHQATFCDLLRHQRRPLSLNMFPTIYCV